MNPNILNPNEPVAPIPNYQPIETSISTNSPSLQRSTPEYLSQTNSLQESFRSSPVGASVPYSSTGTSRSVTPQNQNSSSEAVPIPEKPSLSLSTLRTIPLQVPEPITPQNTPANLSYFGSDAYSSQREAINFAPRIINLDKEPLVTKSETELPLSFLKDSTLKPTVEAKPTATFAPVSAVQVTEKLENLLAERKEDSSELPAETPAKVEESAPESEPTENCQSPSENIVSSNVEDKKDLSKSDGSNDLLVKPEVSETTSVATPAQETRTEKLDAPLLSHGVPSNVLPLQQHHQPQPFVSSANFFAEKLTEQRSGLIHTPATVSSGASTFTDSSKPFAQSASSFFKTPETISSFPSFQYKESSSNAHVDLVTPRSDTQRVHFGGSIDPSFTNPQTPVTQSSWGGGQTSEVIQPVQQPLFYNPAQFEESNRATTGYLQPVTTPATNNAQHYFNNFAAPNLTYDITSGISIEFPITSSATTTPEPTGSATLNPVQTSVNPLAVRGTTDNVPPSFQNLVRLRL